jgi:hypothetical protein
MKAGSLHSVEDQDLQHKIGPPPARVEKSAGSDAP